MAIRKLDIDTNKELNLEGHFNFRENVFLNDKKARRRLHNFIYHNDSSICWILGDSFVEYNLNYVQHYLNKYNKKAVFMSLGGSGVYYSFLRFLNIEDLIMPYHTMLVGVSGHLRDFFDHYHIHSFDHINTSRKRKPSEAFIEAVKLYYQELHDFNQALTITNTIVESFKRRALSKTKHSVFIPTITQYEALDNEPPLFHGVMKKWYKPKKGEMIPPLTPNHWIDDKEFIKAFYKYYDSKFEVWKVPKISI